METLFRVNLKTFSSVVFMLSIFLSRQNPDFEYFPHSKWYWVVIIKGTFHINTYFTV